MRRVSLLVGLVITAILAASALMGSSASAFTCTNTISETTKIVSTLDGASGGAVECLACGNTYGHVTITSLKYTSTVVLRSAEGCTVKMEGIKLDNVENLAIEHIRFTEVLESEPGEKDSGPLTVDHDTFGGLTTGDTVDGSTAVTGIPSTAGMAVGNAIYAASISNDASNQSEITEINSSSEIHVTHPATATLTGTTLGFGPGSGIYVHAGRNGHIKNFTAEDDTFTSLGPCREKAVEGYNNCGSFKGGQCLTLDGESENVTLQDDTCGPYVPAHYVQVTGKSLTVCHNDFLGPSARHDSELHQNYIQIAASSSSVDFCDNIMWRTNAENGFELERYSGASSAEEFENVTLENNLEVQNGGNGENSEAPGGIGFDLCPVKGLTIEHNTLIEPSSTGINLRQEGTGVTECHPGEKYKVEHNVMTKESGVSQPNFSLHEGACEATCEVDYNVTQDTSATGEHSIKSWTPSWEGTTWNPVQEIVEGNPFPTPPTGYYIPTGLTIEAGYKGGGGP